ncbi:MAG: sigma 54-interacting transcriptional regulator, partial [Planctomycetes bacterium]|nr:sigma 54-interacting transcriptional regulator [Planctomycetota bacterium]
MVGGRWSVVGGRWSVVGGRWSVVGGRGNPAGRRPAGRDADCQVVLTDVLCSRVHAVICCRNGIWWVRDNGSRNGTFVNDQKIDEAVLGVGHLVRVGSTEFSFQQSEDAPTSYSTEHMLLTQTIVRNARVDGADANLMALAAIRDSEHAQDLLLLYQLAIRLLSTVDPDEVIRSSIELLHDHAGASLVGFLWLNDERQLTPKLVLPEENSERIPLSESLTRLVCDEGQAVWVANHRHCSTPQNLQHASDALCVPLLHEGQPLGAIHVYLERGRFRQSHFDFAISLANITSMALVRARHSKTLHSDLDRLKARSPGYDEMVGDSPPMVELKTKIERMGRANGSVLIRGESGVGKELIARALHGASLRADRPMLSVNCAAIPADLIESQLFGHMAGAFTGAERDHIGYFQQADLGTLFLDEVGELTLQGQSKLLRVLEGHPFLPVGGLKEIKVD